jgi:hypothetical protein
MQGLRARIPEMYRAILSWAEASLQVSMREYARKSAIRSLRILILSPKEKLGEMLAGCAWLNGLPGAHPPILDVKIKRQKNECRETENYERQTRIPLD